MHQLHGKSAVIYGANSPAGAAVARAFAKEGATVYLAGRSPSQLQPVAREILNARGAVEVAQVDSLDPASVSEHLHQVFVKHGSVDVSLNMAYLGIVGAARLCNLTDEQFAAATFTRVRSNFVTTAAAASHMAHQGRGLILATGAPETEKPDSLMAGQAIASAAIEALCQQLTFDVGSYGVRVAYVDEVPASGEALALELFQHLTAFSEGTSESPREVPNGAASDPSPEADGDRNAIAG